jgi:alginate O-acetyltransferase complex protein AlgI
MIFTSFQYLLFLPAVVLLYWVLPQRYRLPMLLLASYFFYMSWIPVFGLLIFGMTLFNWLWGKLLCKAQAKKKHIFSAGIAINLLCLGYFKYANFFLDSFQTLLSPITHSGSHAALNIILPLGISFFAFEFIHYLFEIYRGRQPIDSFVLFALFASFFPTQIAGPIKRYPDFAAQMQEEKKLSLNYFDEGVPLIIMGVAKKLLLADNLAVLVDMMAKTHSAYGSVETWLIAYAFAMQIYFDFSGYTDIARGSALLFGYHIPINFNLPYIANNMSDFWRRWHISLSTWLRDYLYIPLGGSKGSKLSTDRNLLLTMALGGLWHGAAWNFVVWGVFHGLCLIVHRNFSQWRENTTVLKGFFESKWFSAISVFLTFHVVCIGWVFFRITDIGAAFSMVKKMVFLSPIYTRAEAGHFLVLRPDLPVIVPVVILLVAALLLATPLVGYLRQSGFFGRVPAPLKALYFTLVIFSIVTFCPDSSTPFIYFQF